jgi:hypothetical protein
MQIFGAAVILMLSASVLMAQAYTIDAGGTVKSSATAGTSVQTNQTDSETFVPPSISTTATMGPPQLLPHADASQTISFDGLSAVLSIIGEVHVTKPPFNGSNFLDAASASGQGDLVIALVQAQTLVGTLSSSAGSSSGAAVSLTLSTMDDTQQPMSLSLSNIGTTSQSVTLPSAEYKLHWSSTAQVGGINLPNQESRTFSIQLVPEPAGVVAAALPAALLALGRIRRRR